MDTRRNGECRLAYVSPTADPANNAHYSRFWDKWGASQNFVSSPLLALISPNLLILFTK